MFVTSVIFAIEEQSESLLSFCPNDANIRDGFPQALIFDFLQHLSAKRDVGSIIVRAKWKSSPHTYFFIAG